MLVELRYCGSTVDLGGNENVESTKAKKCEHRLHKLLNHQRLTELMTGIVDSGCINHFT